MNGDYMTMKEIGAVIGESSHAVGKKLKELGLRTAAGKPSRAAFEGEYCDQRWTADMSHYCWAWSGELTIPLLRKAGFGGSEADGQNGTGSSRKMTA